MAKTEKVEKVADLKERIESSQALLLADYRGLTVIDTKELRVALQEAQASFAVVKNTLMRRAADQAGLEQLQSFLSGPTAVAFIRGDAVLAAKRLAEAAKRFPTFEIKGGFMEGRVLSAEDARALSTLEPRDAMLSKVAGLMKSEMSRAASMFQSAQSKLVGLLEAYREKVPGEPDLGETEAETEAETEVPGPPPDATTEETSNAAPEAAPKKEEE